MSTLLAIIAMSLLVWYIARRIALYRSAKRGVESMRAQYGNDWG